MQDEVTLTRLDNGWLVRLSARVRLTPQGFRIDEPPAFIPLLEEVYPTLEAALDRVEHWLGRNDS